MDGFSDDGRDFMQTEACTYNTESLIGARDIYLTIEFDGLDEAPYAQHATDFRHVLVWKTTLVQVLDTDRLRFDEILYEKKKSANLEQSYNEINFCPSQICRICLVYLHVFSSYRHYNCECRPFSTAFLLSTRFLSCITYFGTWHSMLVQSMQSPLKLNLLPRSRNLE
ncbi:hypothetical protein V6N11_020827 [Hibiscus sabdariffa]|uniref:Uncharacterized protein n=1 Tax=Hibiscus sabdariffa TaxID=183260 RepID=A0ABR2Q9L3_9ROSI